VYVVQLVPKLDAGGAEKSAIEIAEALVQAGHSAAIIAEHGSWSARAREVGAEVFPWPIGRKSLSALAAAWRLRRYLMQQSVDIVHSRSRLPSWLCFLVLRSMPKLRRPVWITTVHGMHSVSRYSAIQHSGDHVICVSETTLQFLQQHYPRADFSKVTVIERGADERSYREARNSAAWQDSFYREFPSLSGKPFLLLAARGTRLKGHAQALQLLKALRESGSDMQLLLAGVKEAGRDAYLQELRSLAQSLEVTQHVVFSEARDDLPSIYAECALVLQLSNRPESFGRTVAEALLCGAMVLGWDLGGVGAQLRAAFPHGAVPFDATLDVAALRQTALKLLDEKPRADKDRIFTLARMQAATLELYHAALRKG
jgi:glycosyltransferase involved in cell wall biosynthesis